MEEKTEKGQQIGQLPKRDVLTGNEQFPFQEDRENGSITPNALKSFISSGKGGYMSYITEYNVSIHHPSSGIDSGNKYTLEGAIVQVPETIRIAGLKVSFLNNSGLVETWEFAGGAFENIENWKSNEDKLTDIRDEAIDKIKDAESDAISNFSSQRVTPDMLSESTKQFINASGGGTINNLADDEDLVSVDKGESLSVLKFADRAYNPGIHVGMGYKILRRNIIDGKNILTQEMVNQPHTIYMIQYDYDLNGATIRIPEGCVFDFQGGSLSNGFIAGNNTAIISVDRKIFSNIKFLNSLFSNAFKVEWFGAIVSDNIDSSFAFNEALANVSNVEANGEIYYLEYPIVINSDYKTLKCKGRLLCKYGINGIESNAKYLNIQINQLISDYSPDNLYGDTLGSGIKINNNFNSVISIDFITNFKYGIHLCPRIIEGGERVSGIQYVKFNFSQITAYTCILMDVDVVTDTPGSLWITESQFNGGRLKGYNGISFIGYEESVSEINGHVFNSIGFEKIYNPIALKKCVNSKFLNLRMSEDIYGEYYLNLENCSRLYFDIKSNSIGDKVRIINSPFITVNDDSIVLPLTGVRNSSFRYATLDDDCKYIINKINSHTIFSDDIVVDNNTYITPSDLVTKIDDVNYSSIHKKIHILNGETTINIGHVRGLDSVPYCLFIYNPNNFNYSILSDERVIYRSSKSMDYIYLYIDKTGYKACSSVIGNKIRLTQLKYYKLIDSSNLNSYNKFNLSVNRIAFRRIYLIHMITVFYILLLGKNLSLISAVLRLLIIYLFIKMNPITCILNLFITVS
ncbi:hypothetical protein DW989_04745 [Bacteroides stercoris]|nr:hypothetical protein DW989_04745 [Bacteroides stercoris]